MQIAHVTMRVAEHDLSCASSDCSLNDGVRIAGHQLPERVETRQATEDFLEPF